ncbi:hypothetical protein HY213_04125 [Candidatus Peregrinibacteria bacterium]|nr:hypothetical protein [Candidatus Peregrinibacteria bacterium]
MSLFIDSNENSPYVNDTGWAKNCHVCFGADYSEDCLYCESVYYSRSALDCLYCYNVEVSYECVDCKDCHTLLFSQGCTTCADSAFLFDCIGCNHCFGCVGLRHKTYCMFNKQLSQEEYKKKVDTYLPFTLSSIQRSSEATLQCKLQHPHRAFIGNNNENVIGNHLFNAKNVEYCFDSTDIEDVKYATNMRGAKDCQDINYWGHPGELCYECMAVGEGATRLAFCIASWGGCENLYYCHACIACRDCFGCKGLRHKRYCILNKQYSKEQYESLVPRLIEYMKKTQEWGEMFPVTFSDFAYNETPAQEYHPLSKEEVEHRGWRWLQETNESLKVAKVIPASQLPEKIGDIPDDILNWAIECETTKRPFKIAKQELDFYRAQKLPIPHFHPDERHRRRMLMRNPRKLWKRQCANCQKEIQTSYAPDRPEIVYCEEFARVIEPESTCFPSITRRVPTQSLPWKNGGATGGIRSPLEENSISLEHSDRISTSCPQPFREWRCMFWQTRTANS